MIFNRNLHVAVLVAAMMALGARASLVTSNEVVDAVSAWASANGETFTDGNRAGTAVAATPTYDDDGTTVLYWTVTMSNGGAVIASPDTDLDLVVAFIEKHEGAFPEGHPLPVILKADMKKRLAALAQRNATPSAGGRRRANGSMAMQSATQSTGLDVAVAAANRQWAKYGVGGGMRLMGDTLDGGDASPYVRCIVDGFEQNGRYTHWNQSYVDGKRVYNYYTPNNAVCGCVATAGAAILQFFNCTNDIGNVTGAPTYGVEQEPAGKYKNAYGPCNCTIPGAIDWSILPATSYGGTNATTDVLTDECRKLLGRVTYNLGVLVNMAWDETGVGGESGAQSRDLVNAFKQYGFKTARYVEYSEDPKTDGKEFFKTIYAQLWCGAPVELSIMGGGGHAVVACGYARDPDGDEFCRVFMGWSGEDDAWYKFPKVQNFNIVRGAVTMIGYQDDAVVPVYGEANIPGVDLTLPGYLTNGVPVTVPVNENGYFGIRVPVSLDDKTIVYEPRNSKKDVDPEGLAELDAALPDEIPFSILNATVKSTIESGRAVAERDGKALLMVSGQPGTPRTKALMEYLYWLDDTTDFSNKYVLVFNNIKSADPNRPDGNPVIGVFDPVGFKAVDRWQDVNERLSYNAFIDFEASGETNEVVYTFSETNTVVMTNGVAEVLATGYDAYLRRHAGIVMNITGLDARAGTADPFEVSTVQVVYGGCTNDWTYGSYTNVWTNGEVVVFSALGTVTNKAQTMIVSCVGWTTNEPFAKNPMTGQMELQPYNPGNEVELQLVAGDDIKLTWIWDISHYRVTASTTQALGDESAVTPADSWVRAGDRIAITAKEMVLYRHFSGWEVMGSSGDYSSSTTKAALSENGTSLWFCVYEPVTVSANYTGRTEPETVPLAVILEVEPAELLDDLENMSIKPLLGEATAVEWNPLDVDWGTNWVVDTAFSYGGTTLPFCIDATNGVWLLKNASLQNIEQLSDGILRVKDPAAPAKLTFKWELQSSEEPPGPEPGPEPGPISIKSLEQTVGGSWTVTVEGAVKDCWYWLYATDDLSDFAGDAATWTADLVDKQKALVDGDIVFDAPSGGPTLFWRARATSKEDGD